MRILASRCLLGDDCRYDGGARPCDAVRRLASVADVMGVCPECDGGLSSPRPPAERAGGRVVLSDGTDVTVEFARGAQETLRRALDAGATLAVLKSKSPSCGSRLIYDGSFTGSLTRGAGVAAELLEGEGICVVSEDEVKDMRPSVEHPVAIVLGSGLGALAREVKPVRRIDYADIDGFPVDARPIEGHVFEATIGTVDDVPVVVYPGRVHLYQGYSAAEVTALVRHAHRLGCHDIIFACATGAVPEMAGIGLGVLTDHINLTGTNPLVEQDDLSDVETPFAGMADAYTPYLRELAIGVAADLGIELGSGVYAGLLGPSFETPAEIGALRTMGVSYVGMSTVCEVIMAHALGMKVLGLTLAANVAGDPDVSHETVLECAHDYEDDFERLVRGVLRML
ncbi:MAG: purine-nucleoside phosphorylase [Atopobiaceae bacterium]|jgi:purine-nucleoside phosphorylase|nr:purine-nucleoside phosphorylase [Atopobiaceae bacterium]MCI2174016.1 purine-nucleoside phosphorylase [Atopobiaceae bacterium]MCI2207894.1 purine-nucleoside phosphorylase [Atopobiaceae bacterium]